MTELALIVEHLKLYQRDDSSGHRSENAFLEFTNLLLQ